MARDGRSYTLLEFLAWYGDEVGQRYWVEATLAGAPQPGGPGADAPPVWQDVPDAPVGHRTGTVGALQPGGNPVNEMMRRPVPSRAPQAAPPVRPTAFVGALQPGGNSWETCVFLRQTLRDNQARLRRECPQLHLATTPREAMNKAYALAEYLPLPIQAFVNLTLLSGLVRALDGVGDVLAVSAEGVPRIPRAHRPHSCRIDFFVYCRNGTVIRHHPGRTSGTSMYQHSMPSGSVLFSLAEAQQIGVGASLHLRPPGRAADAGVPQPGVVLCTLADVDASCTYDLQMVNWRRVREDYLQPSTEWVDISDGHLFPWWLMLGGTGRQRRLLQRGVTRVVAFGRNLAVTLMSGEVVLYD